MKYIIILLMVFCMFGCSSVIQEVKKSDAAIAEYLGVSDFNIDCKAGVVQADVDISDDPVLIRKASAVTKNANVDSPDYKLCYSKVAWLYWSGAKMEGAIRTWIKKLVEYGVIVP